MSTDADSAAAKKDGGKKKMVMMLVAALVLAGGGYFMFLKPKPAEDAHAKPKQEPGEVLQMEPITMNLADGHYLKMGLALQFALAEGGGHGGGAKHDGSQALDLAISHFSNREVKELSAGAAREKAKKELAKKVRKAYHDEVMDIYFTEFVMQ